MFLKKKKTFFLYIYIYRNSLRPSTYAAFIVEEICFIANSLSQFLCIHIPSSYHLASQTLAGFANENNKELVSLKECSSFLLPTLFKKTSNK